MTMLNSHSAHLIDCTFRDGGYYTNWTYPSAMVNDYLYSLQSLPIGVIELGFTGKGCEVGEFANVDNMLARDLRFNQSIQLAVMLDAKDYIENANGLEARLDKDLGPKLNDGIDIVRVAVSYQDAENCEQLLDSLKNRGYRVFLFLVQIDIANHEELSHCLEFLKSSDQIEAVYLADSLGTMRPDRVEDLVRDFYEEVGADIGFHAHDSSGFAITNSLHALESGASWLDCTVAGMGRGAGNASTEPLLRAVAMESCSKKSEEQLQLLILRHFNPLNEIHRWGDNLFYQIGAANALHPTYVQEVLRNHSLTNMQKFSWIKNIPTNSTVFNNDTLITAKQNSTRRISNVDNGASTESQLDREQVA